MVLGTITRDAHFNKPDFRASHRGVKRAFCVVWTTAVGSPSLELFNYPPYLIIHPPLLEGVGAEGAEKILGYFGSILIDFLHKIDEFESKIAKIFAPAARLS